MDEVSIGPLHCQGYNKHKRKLHHPEILKKQTGVVNTVIVGNPN